VKVNHVKEPTDKFKLEHLQDAVLKTWPVSSIAHIHQLCPKKVEVIVLSTNGTYYTHSLIGSSC
jgi:hypothetical protein